MSIRTKLTIGILFLIQLGVFGWSYWEKVREAAAFEALFETYLQQPKSVKSIDLSGQEINRLIDMKQFENLEFLNLSNNNFETIPDEIYELPNLKYLDLSYNQIQEVQKIKNISNVNLSHNKISIIHTVDNVDSLFLSNNKIENFDNLYIRFQLKHLDISNNKLERLHKLEQLKHFCLSIDMSNNKFTAIGETMYQTDILLEGSFPKSFIDSTSIIKSLIMKNCNLSQVRYISEPNYELEYLDLSNNKFKVFDHFHQCKNLQFLILNECVFYDKLELYNESLKTLEIKQIDLNSTIKLTLKNLENISINDSFFKVAYPRDLYLPNMKNVYYKTDSLPMIYDIKNYFPNAIIN